nr:hypothetical protein CFP56_22010 [Quercus suber]
MDDDAKLYHDSMTVRRPLWTESRQVRVTRVANSAESRLWKSARDELAVVRPASGTTLVPVMMSRQAHRATPAVPLLPARPQTAPWVCTALGQAKQRGSVNAESTMEYGIKLQAVGNVLPVVGKTQPRLTGLRDGTQFGTAVWIIRVSRRVR